MYDLDGQVIEANPAALDFLSAATKEEIKLTKAGLAATFEVSTPDGEPLPVEDWPVWRVMHGEDVADIVLWVRNKRTGRQWVSSHSGRPLRFLGTNETFAVLSIRDITKSKTAELQVQARETRLKSAFDSFIDQVIIVDQQLKPTYLNFAARRAGMPIAAGGETLFWHAAVRDALTGAKPVIPEVNRPGF